MIDSPPPCGTVVYHDFRPIALLLFHLKREKVNGYHDSKFLAERNIPDAISNLDFSRPTSLPKPTKWTRAHGNVRFQAPLNWLRQKVGGVLQSLEQSTHARIIHRDEPDPSPPHMWTLIEYDLVKNDKIVAEHYMKNLEIIRESPELLEKVSNYERIMWDYQSKTQKYKRDVRNYPAEETMKDLVSYIECLRTCIERIEQAERHQAFRAQFESEEDYEDYLIDQQNEEFLDKFPLPRATWVEVR